MIIIIIIKYDNNSNVKQKKKTDIINEILIETLSIFQITNCQLNYIFI